MLTDIRPNIADVTEVPSKSAQAQESGDSPPSRPCSALEKKPKPTAVTRLKCLQAEITTYLDKKVNDLNKDGWSLGILQFINHFYSSSPCLKNLSPSKFLLQKILTSVLDLKIERSLSSKFSRWIMETLTLPFSSSLKDIDFSTILTAARRAIPPGLRERLTIVIGFDNPIPIGFLLENNSFGKMSLEETLNEQSICHCLGRYEFKAMPNCDHIITTNPKLIEKDFPVLFSLCKMGVKYRVQTRRVIQHEVFKAIDSFRA